MIKNILDIQFNKQYRIEIKKNFDDNFNTIGVYENCELSLKDDYHIEMVKNASIYEAHGKDYESIPDEDVIIIHQLDIETKAIIISEY